MCTRGTVIPLMQVVVEELDSNEQLKNIQSKRFARSQVKEKIRILREGSITLAKLGFCNSVYDLTVFGRQH